MSNLIKILKSASKTACNHLLNIPFKTKVDSYFKESKKFVKISLTVNLLLSVSDLIRWLFLHIVNHLIIPGHRGHRGSCGLHFCKICEVFNSWMNFGDTTSTYQSLITCFLLSWTSYSNSKSSQWLRSGPTRSSRSCSGWNQRWERSLKT